MAEVFEGVVLGDGAFARKVAIKRLLHYQSEVELAAFADEARIIAQLDHPNIVSVFDFGAVDGQPFQVLELVDGLDLKELEDRGRQRNCPAPAEAVLLIASHVARALDYAHRAVDNQHRPLGIVHRDVTPHNILVSWAGHVKLADFGIAMAADRRAVTEPGVVKGKLSFMAPEYLLSGAVSPLADVFGLGCVIHFLLAGHSPYGSDEGRWGAARGAPPPIASSIEDDVAELIAWACHPTPDRRCPSAVELATALERVLYRRAGASAPRILTDWLRDLRSRQTPAPAERLAQLFALEPTGLEEESGLARFQSVPAGAEHAVAEEPGWVDGGSRLDATPSARAVNPERDRPNPEATGEPDPALPTSPDDATEGGLDFLRTEIDGQSLPTLAPLPEPTAPTRATDLPHDKLARHAVLAKLRRAGRGELMLARPRAPMPDRPRVVMLKIWPPAITRDVAFVSLVTREATLRGQLSDPNLPAVYELGVDDGRFVVELEYPLGRTLRQVVGQLRRPLSPGEVAAVGSGMARGLAAARRIRDALGQEFTRVPCEITLDHVFLTFDGRALVTDFEVKSVAERIVAEDWSRSTDDVARRREVWKLVSTLQSFLPENQDGRAQYLRSRIAQILEEANSARVPGDLASALDGFAPDAPLMLRAMMEEAFGETADKEREVLRRLSGDFQPVRDPEPEPTFVSSEIPMGRVTVGALDAAAETTMVPIEHVASPPPPETTDVPEATDALGFVAMDRRDTTPLWLWALMAGFGTLGAAVTLTMCVGDSSAPRPKPGVLVQAPDKSAPAPAARRRPTATPAIQAQPVVEPKRQAPPNKRFNPTRRKKPRSP